MKLLNSIFFVSATRNSSSIELVLEGNKGVNLPVSLPLQHTPTLHPHATPTLHPHTTPPHYTLTTPHTTPHTTPSHYTPTHYTLTLHPHYTSPFVSSITTVMHESHHYTAPSLPSICCHGTLHSCRWSI